MRPLRRPARVLVVVTMLAVVALGVYTGLRSPATIYNQTDTLTVRPDSVVVAEVGARGDAALAGLRSGDRVVSYEGEPMTPNHARHVVSPYPFSGSAGDTLRLEVERDDATLGLEVVLGRQEAADARRLGLSAVAVDGWTKGLGYVGLLAFAVVGVVLVARARARGYLASLGVALISVAGGSVVITMSTSETALPGPLAAFAIGLGIVMFLSALPAVAAALVRFPDGRYTPPWTRWTRTVAAVGMVAYVVLVVVAVERGLAREANMAVNVMLALLLTVPAVGLIQKYRRSEDGVVRQQMKWVVLPLAAFVVAFAGGALGAEAFPVFDSSESATGYVFDVVASALLILTFAAIPLGVLAGVLNFRPWDADQWIARSAAVGAATLGLAAVFAGGAEALRVGLRSSMGDGAESVAAALAAVVALAVFNPMREWLTKRADADLHRTRERLTERLPLLLAGRQVVASPEEVGRVAIAAVRDALRTDRAAVLDLDPDGWHVVAADGLPAGAVLEWAGATLEASSMPPCSVQVWEDPTFVLRVPLWSVEHELVGVLALGTHGRGRGYSTEERKALDAASRSLAEALRVAERREEAQARQYARLAALVDRLGPAGDGAALEVEA